MKRLVVELHTIERGDDPRHIATDPEIVVATRFMPNVDADRIARTIGAALDELADPEYRQRFAPRRRKGRA